ncbi:MAG: Na-K-Cl cotransporter [Fibrobacteria bacterium]|nr:Na-K-Cl cotransporter [Fibrobacteria bacterium]
MNIRRFGTFEGVFTPSLLTILGVIMYLRLGWVVGHAGFGGAILIILLAKVVTITTGLSISSLATNVRVGAGGTYNLISRSLGLEVGGAIGIPLYISLALGAAMYIIGFTEAWAAIFPAHDPRIVSSIVLVSISLISVLSAKIAMRIQFIIMAVIFASLFSFLLGKAPEVQVNAVWGEFKDYSFWVLFAIFFPAVTGIEAGAAMSGELKDPKKSLPIGILGSVIISLLVYVGIAYWYSRMASADSLKTNYTIIMDVSRWKIPVIAGILGATLSSALGSILGAPRTLKALGQDNMLPFKNLWIFQTKKGEPVFALLFTAIVVEVLLLTANLNTIAPLLTMFFLITYAMVNMVVAIEQGIGIYSFRPTFKVPVIVPMIGALWCLIVMFLIDPKFAGASLVIITGIYLYQVKRGVESKFGDVRSGLFNALAEWSLQISMKFPKSSKSWKLNLLIPVEDPKNWRHMLPIVRNLLYPRGTARFFSVKIVENGVDDKVVNWVKMFVNKNSEEETALIEESTTSALETDLQDLLEPIRSEKLFISSNVLEARTFIEAWSLVTQTMKETFFPPNAVLLSMSGEKSKRKNLEKMIAIATKEEMGILLLYMDPKTGWGNQSKINIWFQIGRLNEDLLLLSGMQLADNWHADIRLISVVEKESDYEKADRLLKAIGERARMPKSTEYTIFTGDVYEYFSNSPAADINLFSMLEPPDWKKMRTIAETVNTSCMFIKDSGAEDVKV